jgi:hypothetical protein
MADAEGVAGGDGSAAGGEQAVKAVAAIRNAADRTT